jgi:hypothetical protein
MYEMLRDYADGAAYAMPPPNDAGFGQHPNSDVVHPDFGQEDESFFMADQAFDLAGSTLMPEGGSHSFFPPSQQDPSMMMRTQADPHDDHHSYQQQQQHFQRPQMQCMGTMSQRQKESRNMGHPQQFSGHFPNTMDSSSPPCHHGFHHGHQKQKQKQQQQKGLDQEEPGGLISWSRVAAQQRNSDPIKNDCDFEDPHLDLVSPLFTEDEVLEEDDFIRDIFDKY